MPRRRQLGPPRVKGVGDVRRPTFPNRPSSSFKPSARFHRGRGSGSRAFANESKHSSEHLLVSTLRLVFEKQSQQFFKGSVIHLESLRTCPDVANIGETVNFGSYSFCLALATVLSECAVLPPNLCVDSNEIVSLTHLLRALIEKQLNKCIHAISAQHNLIRNFEMLGKLSEFPNLIELRLCYNPLTRRTDYPKRLLDTLPSLQGLDGVAIERPGLSLPWPHTPPYYQEHHVQILQWIESCVRSMANEGVSSASTIFATSCRLSILNTKAFHRPCTTVSHTETMLNAQQMVHATRMRLGHCSGTRGPANAQKKLVTGRDEIVEALRQVLFVPNFRLDVEFNRQASVVSIPQTEYMMPHYVVTVHLLTELRHEQLPSDSIGMQSCVDWTFVISLVERTWRIENMVLLFREVSSGNSPILICHHPDRLAGLVKQLNTSQLPSEMLRIIGEQVRSDAEFTSAVKEVLSIGPELLSQSQHVSSGNLAMASVIARLVASTKLRPERALALLQETNGNLQTARQTAAGIRELDSFLPP